MSRAAAALSAILGPQPPPFALLHRPHTGDGRSLDLLIGRTLTAASVAEIPLRDAPSPAGGPHDALVVLPYRQVTERGFACVDDHEPLLVLRIEDQAVVGLDDLPRSASRRIEVRNQRYDVSDADYATAVRRVIDEEIGSGQGANFVLRRSYEADLPDYTPAQALSLFRNLLAGERGAYWTFLIHTGPRTFVGATPERHVSLTGGMAVMNPISGTFRYGPDRPTTADVLDFLGDRKEIDELAMVLDEELKMMARVCADGGRVLGPELREMARLAHTEYFIRGRTAQDVRTVLRETMFAPTVIGSPLENACRVIARHEPTPRGYYSGVAALIGHERAGQRDMDSAILIRTAEINGDGRLRIGTGATLVRHSDADSEVAETGAKLASLLSALHAEPSGTPPPPAAAPRFGQDPHVRAALDRRNATAARFWMAEEPDAEVFRPGLAGRRVLVVDAEDTFTWMLRHQLRALGMRVEVCRYDDAFDTRDHELVVLGPGPGDPGDPHDEKIAVLRRTAAALVAGRRPLLAVCLSHQVLSAHLGLELRRRPTPNQGIQVAVDLFGRTENVGFYNAFAAYSAAPAIRTPAGDRIEICGDRATGEVYALRGPTFASMQFHPESILTTHGLEIIARTVARLPGC